MGKEKGRIVLVRWKIEEMGRLKFAIDLNRPMNEQFRSEASITLQSGITGQWIIYYYSYRS